MTKRKQREVDFAEQQKALAKLYCSVDDVMAVTGLSYPVAAKLVREIVTEMESKGEFILCKKPYLIPTKKLLRKLGLTEKDVKERQI